jgi:hypothetical protein
MQSYPIYYLPDSIQNKMTLAAAPTAASHNIPTLLHCPPTKATSRTRERSDGRTRSQRTRRIRTHHQGFARREVLPAEELAHRLRV